MGVVLAVLTGVVLVVLTGVLLVVLTGAVLASLTVACGGWGWCSGEASPGGLGRGYDVLMCNHMSMIREVVPQLPAEER
eukprot:2548971-Pyramimonas_sp.AAC.1